MGSVTAVHTRAELKAHFRRIGLERGDAVVLHSSLRSIGRVDGGAETVVFALLEALGPEGLLVAPTYTYWTQRFNPESDPSLTGRISETIRRWPGAVRSWHPTHSVAAIGKGAGELCVGHQLVGAISHGSPLDRLAAQGGRILLLGVGHVTNSTIHVGEVHANAPYLDIPFSADSFTSATVVTPSGDVSVEIKQPSGCSRAFGVIEHALRQRGAIRDGLVGEAVTQLLRGQDVIDTVVDLLRVDPAALLCNDPDSYRCAQARRCIESAHSNKKEAVR
jgi:aminoglycoside 3-N-acetyltransferase